jgi:hypothetical protein
MVASYDQKEKKRKKDSSNSIWWQGVVGKKWPNHHTCLANTAPQGQVAPIFCRYSNSAEDR